LLGKKLKGRYEILERIGIGGMAVVYKAKDILLNRIVAIKFLKDEFVHDSEFIERFRREAQAAASLSHPNIVQIFDVGEDRDIYYIVMEYVEGETLKEYIKREAPLKADKAVNITMQILEALQHAHGNHIVHRDIKPQNILINKSGKIKVADFGIARAITTSTITHTNSVVGSVHYLSPEQAKGGIVKESSDLYSLGVILYEMLTGKLPFSGETPISVALKHLQEQITKPRLINPNIPLALENIIIKALMKDNLKRYNSSNEMLNDLKNVFNKNNNIESFHDYLEENVEEPTIIVENLAKKMQGSELRTAKPKRKSKKIIGIILSLTFITLISWFIVDYFNNLLSVPDVIVPDVVNKSKEEAIEAITKVNLQYKFIENTSLTVLKDHVIKQDPLPNAKIKQGQTVYITISSGKSTEIMPDLVHLTRREAENKLKKLGFQQIQILEEFNEEIPNEMVIRQKPEANLEVIPSEVTVQLIISKGKKTFPMPNLIGLKEEEAKQVLQNYNLKIGTIYREATFEQEAGIVFRQFPYEKDDPVSAESIIDLYISSGYPADAKKVMQEIILNPQTDKGEEFRIVITDAVKTNFELINEVLNTPKAYQIELIISQQKNGIIQIYRNNVLEESKIVSY